MEIGRIRKELNDLLDNIMEHSNKYSEERTIPSLQVGAVLTKVNRLQERMSVLKYLLEEQEIVAQKEKEPVSYKEKEPVAKEPVVETTKEVQNIFTTEVIQPTFEQEEIVEQVKETPIIEEKIEPIIQQEIVTETIVSEQKAIPKLIDSLTLNDRYLYANELFNKDMSAFNELVKKIDSCSTFDEAQKLYLHLDWEVDNEHVLSFTDLVERRFL